jgi:hypothetical protein
MKPAQVNTVKNIKTPNKMILTISDFDGYDKDCPTIKKIKSWIEGKGGSFDMQEMLSIFEKDHYSFKSEVIRYINSQHLNQYLQKFILQDEPFQFWHEILRFKKNIEERSEKFGSILDANELLKKEERLESDYERKNRLLDQQIEKYKDFNNMEELLELNQKLKKGYDYRKGTVVQVLNYFFSQSFHSQSYVTTNDVMQSVLHNLCGVATFDEDDFLEIIKNFNFEYWGSRYLESFYATMIVAGNNSAWKSFEKAIGRTPFILKNKRMYEGIAFRVVENNKWIYYRCTGWNADKKLKLVTDKDEKQKRFSFENKEFKAFFKDKKIQF